jgi:hypothetical protein
VFNKKLKLELDVANSRIRSLESLVDKLCRKLRLRDYQDIAEFKYLRETPPMGKEYEFVPFVGKIKNTSYVPMRFVAETKKGKVIKFNDELEIKQYIKWVCKK